MSYTFIVLSFPITYNFGVKKELYLHNPAESANKILEVI